ncbi:MAG: hypothetical protein ACOYT7_03310 [Patescibacteria group bacterium]
MIEKISAPITVGVVYDHKIRKTVPSYVLWEGKTHKINKVGLHHTYRTGRTLYHAFSVATPTLFLRLVLNTDTLAWRLEEIADGLPD